MCIILKRIFLDFSVNRRSIDMEDIFLAFQIYLCLRNNPSFLSLFIYVMYRNDKCDGGGIMKIVLPFSHSSIKLIFDLCNNVLFFLEKCCLLKK